MNENGTHDAAASDANPTGRGAPQQPATAPRNPAPDAVLGQVVWLMMNMPQYRHVFLADLEWMVLPPILLSQYRLFRAGDRVVLLPPGRNFGSMDRPMPATSAMAARCTLAFHSIPFRLTPKCM